MSGSLGLVERTGKGGIGAIISTNAASFTDATTGFNIAIPDGVYTFAKANPTHVYYYSVYHRVTRAGALPGTIKAFSCPLGGDTKFGMMMSASTNTTGTVTNASAIDDTVGGPRFRDVASTPASGWGSDTTNLEPTYRPGQRSAWLVGNRHQLNQVTSPVSRRGQGGSRIFYRFYMEDLTVSGRSYATVNALDVELFNLLFGTGGRYTGDTFTDPVTIP
jgi:hypothetical protein